MSNIEPEVEEHEDGPAALRDALKRAEQRAKEAEERAAANDGASRENVMLRAGVDLDSKLGQMFSRSYEGDLEVDAVKAEWSDLAPAPAKEEPRPEEAEQQTERAGLAADAPPPTQMSDVHPHRAGIAEYERLVGEGYTPQEASVQFFDKLITGAVSGDSRVLWDETAKADHRERVPLEP